MSDNNRILKGESIILTPITYEDTSYIVKWRNNQEVRKNFIFQTTFTNEMHENWMRSYVESGKVVQFIIRVGDEKTPVGSVYLRDLDWKNKKAEFGIFIGETTMQGRGIGREATRLICTFAFEELKLHKVFLRVFADNERALKSYESAGFVREGCFKDDILDVTGYRDMIFMAMYNMHDIK